MPQRDPYLEKLLAEADQRLRRNDFAGALETLDRADKDFPHQRDVLARRELCLKRLGRKTFAYGSEQKEKVSFQDVQDALTWDRENIVERSEGPVRKISRRLETALPSMVDPLEQKPAAPSPYLLNEQKPNQLLVLALLVAYLGLAFFLATRGPSAGEIRYFSGLPFAWIPPASIADIEALDAQSADALRRGFWMSQTEVSIPDWERILHGREVDADGTNPLPKTGITFSEAEQFAQALSRMGEGSYRIPTAAEWQWAARAGQRNGGLAVDDHAWHADNSEYRAQPVAQLAPNEWSLFDILGNAEEWVDTAPPPEEAPGFPDRYRLLMGGSFLSLPSIIELEIFSFEDMNTPTEAAGVRLIREPQPRTGNLRRLLTFPEDRPAGVLYVNGQRYGDAVGEVVVLEDDEVRLSVFANHPADLSGLNQLAPTDLYGLTIEHPRLEPDALKQLGRLTELVELELRGIEVEGDVLSLLAHHSALETLTLEGAGIDASDIRPFQNLQSLRHLHLRKNPEVNAAAVDVLRTLQQLETLDVTDTGLSAADLTELQLAIPLCHVIPQPTDFTLSDRLRRATLDGELKLLLHQFAPAVPPERPFVYDGFKTRTTFGAHQGLSHGYWVYVEPYWYVWKHRGAVPEPNVLPWIAPNVVGEPALEPSHEGKSQWAPAAASVEPPWLLLEFSEHVQPAELAIYWTSSRYPIRSVAVFTDSGEAVAFANPRQQQYTEWSAHSVEYLDATPEFTEKHAELATNRVRIAFEPVTEQSSDAPPFAIDAIALVSQSGRSQWTQAAGASSSYTHAVDMPDEATTEEQRSYAPDTLVEPPRFRGFPGLLESIFKENNRD